MDEELLYLGVYQEVQVQEHAARRNRLRLYRRQLRDAINPFELQERPFCDTFRLSREAARNVVNTLAGRLPESRILWGIPSYLKVLVTLNFYASGSYQRRVGDSFMAAMSQTSVSRSIVAVTQAINDVMLRRWVSFPAGQAGRNAIKRGFMEANNFPGVVGCLDGTQVAIVAPTFAQRAELYVNRKGYHSLNVQLICNSKLEIMAVNAQHPGGHHDQFIWRGSRIRNVFATRHENGAPADEWILGDSGYTAEPWLLLPMANQPEGSPGARYTLAHCQTRNCVERCIGVLKGRWRCLRKERSLHYTPRQAGLIVNACVVMHNVAVRYRLPAPQPFLDEVDELPPLAQGVPAAAGNARANLFQQGLAVRDRLIAMRFT